MYRAARSVRMKYLLFEGDKNVATERDRSRWKAFFFFFVTWSAWRLAEVPAGNYVSVKQVSALLEAMNFTHIGKIFLLIKYSLNFSYIVLKIRGLWKLTIMSEIQSIIRLIFFLDQWFDFCCILILDSLFTV